MKKEVHCAICHAKIKPKDEKIKRDDGSTVHKRCAWQLTLNGLKHNLGKC
jgi:hypothetical protein